MILKGNQRAGAADLATHLLNVADNERIEVAEVTGTAASDLHGAFAEYAALASGTRCREPLYSLSINPSAPISREQYMAAIARIERRLGLSGQPRAVIFHIKAGSAREHCHVVWSRIDAAKMRAVHLAHDHMKLRTLARELAYAFGLDLPPGLAEDRDIDRITAPDQSLAEKAQAESSGIAPDDRRANISAAWRSADSPEAFAAALEAHGYFLANGDRRAFVVVDRFGHVHSLSRQIDGVKTRQLKAFFADFVPMPLDEARGLALSREQAADDRRREAIKVKLAELASLLRHKQAARRLILIRQGRQLRGQHGQEAAALYAAQYREASRVSARVFSAVMALFSRLPVLRSVLSHIRRQPFLPLAERHRLEREALVRRHAREWQDHARGLAALRKVERRERQSLHRSVLRTLRARDHRYEMFAANAEDIITPKLHALIDSEPFTFDPVEAELDRLYALLEHGLCSPFNAAAGIKRKARKDSSESLAPRGLQPKS